MNWLIVVDVLQLIGIWVGAGSVTIGVAKACSQRSTGRHQAVPEEDIKRLDQFRQVLEQEMAKNRTQVIPRVTSDSVDLQDTEETGHRDESARD